MSSIIDSIRIKQDWKEDEGYTFEKVEAEEQPPFQVGGTISININAPTAGSFKTPPVPAQTIAAGFQGTMLQWSNGQVDSMSAGILDVMSHTCQIYELLEFHGMVGNALNHAGGASQLTPYMQDIHLRNPTDRSEKVHAISGAAKGAARIFEREMLKEARRLAKTAQRITVSTHGLTFAAMDNLLNLMDVPSFYLLNGATMRSYHVLLLITGGAATAERLVLPSGRNVPAYRGVPFLRTDYLDDGQVLCMDIADQDPDPARKNKGVVGLYPAPIPISLTKLNPNQYRLKKHAGFARFSVDGIGLLEFQPNP